MRGGRPSCAPSFRSGENSTTVQEGTGHEEMGIHHLQQVLREVGMARIELELDARGQESKALQQALDVRVGAFEPLDPEASGDARIGCANSRAHLAHELQLAVVVLEQSRIHRSRHAAPESVTLTLPDIGVDACAQHELLRHRLPPELRVDPERQVMASLRPRAPPA